MSDVLKRVNEGYYEKQLSRFRNDAPFPTQLGIELLTLAKQLAEENHSYKQALEFYGYKPNYFSGVDHEDIPKVNLDGGEIARQALQDKE